ncbi:glycosyl hydrolase [Nostoc sp. LEGE 06077]|uniref:glycosyl hydrolase n=1 Tax=Nostoc sp. LEGE 06077 TaxID=915325 RepID=UPI00188264F8|nr:glycosyl hydrolase [Nostoc sp. LEGE 06077]MBE9207388.1 glycosyl hydrolase [Nostoc sp. LEGE 06077]
MNQATTPLNQPGLVLTPGPEGWWDSERISSPQVLRCLDGIWRMWYYGRDASFDRQINLPTGRCGLAISADGIHWQRVQGSLTGGAVFEPHLDSNRFDSAHVGVSNVYFRDNLYWMWYFGGDRTIVEMGKFQAKGLNMRPGCAISRDGINWVRLEGNYQGAFLGLGKPGEFDALFCAWPQVLPDDDGTWKMYYHTLNPDKGFLVGLAVSTDGLHWEKVGQILAAGESGSFDDRGIGTRHVLKIEGQYVMFYEGVNTSGYHSIGLAISDDGIHWQKETGDQPGGSVFSHAQKNSGLWDARAIGTPCIVPMDDGSFWMYYIGANEGGYDELSSQHQIGLAVSDGTNFRQWHRWGE